MRRKIYIQLTVKQVLMVLAFVFATLPGFAQLGVQAGWNSSGFAWSGGGDHRAQVWNQGFNAGLIYRKLLRDHIVVQPALLFSQKGTDQVNFGRYYTPGLLNYRNKLSYAELAIPVMYRLPFNYNSNSFDIGAGPYAAVLVSAVAKSRYVDGEKTTGNYRIGADTSADFRRMDAGVAIYAGLKFRRVSVNAVYDWGLTNIIPIPGQTITNGCLSLNAGVFLFKNYPTKKQRGKARP